MQQYAELSHMCIQCNNKAAFTFSCCVPLRRRATRLCTRLKGLHFCDALRLEFLVTKNL